MNSPLYKLIITIRQRQAKPVALLALVVVLLVGKGVLGGVGMGIIGRGGEVRIVYLALLSDPQPQISKTFL